ncbi:rRNA processing protein [Nadsonia fulvescens var. elongata DSM 6958]|uniref:Pre-rRNA-processing protein PNO1 n=1 Tax=Nadsonia fulvescens var. elongata DSM 6958 TaxID=857566 RepID=A0A1E3PMA6_9ASCO|nr:rRNA processing protein [Nadsonia fulvescens var. elongata DSM 6958]
MGAPTARKDVDVSPVAGAAGLTQGADEEIMIDAAMVISDDHDHDHDMSSMSVQEKTPNQDGMVIDQDGKPVFTSAKAIGSKVKLENRRIPIPPHRMSPLRSTWMKIYQPLVEHLKLQVRMNLKRRAVELRTCKDTTDSGALQKGADFIKAFSLGFDVDDALALLRLDDLYIETFEVKDVKSLHGDHLGRAIGRIAGKDGKTKFAIENASRTRIVLADSKIHILGGFTNGKIAREAIVSLILGSPPGKVYGNLRIVASRMKERF